MASRRTRHLVAMALVGGITAANAPVSAQPVVFLSTQGVPLEAAQKMRGTVLAGSGLPVDFQPQDYGPFLTRIGAEMKAGKGTVSLIGGLDSDFQAISSGLSDMSELVASVQSSNISPIFLTFGKLGTAEPKYVPWMQATYLMVANKRALPYLPEGAQIGNLTYDQLLAWAKAMHKATGSPKFGIPAGPQGLLARFLEGYLYPSYTHSTVTKFRSPEAEAMWSSFKELWAETNPAATSYNFMQEPLQTGAVWVAWDHINRLQDALDKQPSDFVAFPAPVGPKGRGFMTVVAGLAIPKTAPDPAAARKLIAYLIRPETQIATLRATAFFPVVDTKLPDDLPASVKILEPAVTAQAGSPNAVAGLLPSGLGNQGGQLNKVYVDTFQRIVLAGQDIRFVLDNEGQILNGIMSRTAAPCWAPDLPSQGACPVE